jgi:hypothetical protein
MHSIEDIIADAQSAVAASIRSAYDAGREHQTTEMRDKFVAFFEGVIGPFSKAPAAEAAPAPAEDTAEAPVEASAEPASEVAAEPAAEAAAEAPAEAPAEAAPAG